METTHTTKTPELHFLRRHSGNFACHSTKAGHILIQVNIYRKIEATIRRVCLCLFSWKFPKNSQWNLPHPSTKIPAEVYFLYSDMNLWWYCKSLEVVCCSLFCFSRTIKPVFFTIQGWAHCKHSLDSAFQVYWLA